jgi:hypothetical protein
MHYNIIFVVIIEILLILHIQIESKPHSRLHRAENKEHESQNQRDRDRNEVYVPSWEYQPISHLSSIPPGLDIKISLDDNSSSNHPTVARVPNPFSVQLWVNINRKGSSSSSSDVVHSLIQVVDDGSDAANSALVGSVRSRCSRTMTSLNGCYVRFIMKRKTEIDHKQHGKF